MPLGYPEIGGCLSTCLPGTLPRRVTVPTSQEGGGVEYREGPVLAQGRHNLTGSEAWDALASELCP